MKHVKTSGCFEIILTKKVEKKNISKPQGAQPTILSQAEAAQVAQTPNWREGGSC